MVDEEKFSKFSEGAFALFNCGSFTYALTSESKKSFDTLYRLDTESGTINEIKLRTLAKNSASKLPEIR